MNVRTQEQKGLKDRAGADMVIFLENWKRKKRLLKWYRLCLITAIVLSCLCFAGAGYRYLYRSLPSVIRITAGTSASFSLNLPVTGEIFADSGSVSDVSSQEASNIPTGSVVLDLSHTVTLQAAAPADYRMIVRLFGWIPLGEVPIQVIEEQELIPVGIPIGIYVETDGLLVVGTGEFTGIDGLPVSPAKSILKSNDYILALNGEAVTDKEAFVRDIEASGGDEVVLTIRREGEVTKVNLTPLPDQDGKYKLGVWIRDNAQGVGTMTYVDAEGNFAALGHSITDVDTSALMEISSGTIYQTTIISLSKGTSGDPGEMTGLIVYASDRILGKISVNSSQGIFGICNRNGLSLSEEDAIPIALKQEVRLGEAQILCAVDGEARYYDVEITALDLADDNSNRGIALTVTDPELLELTGGIIQGMSGAPIIQDGKFVGAVTHVLVNNPEKGYGIFIENMLSEMSEN